MTEGTLTGYTVSDSYGNTDYEVHFGPTGEKRARALAGEFNRYEWQGPLDPEFTERRNRLKRLAPDFGSFYSEGPEQARFPVRPGKYLVRDMGVGWHAESHDELADTLADVEAAIAEDEANIWRVVDLDTGDEIPFKREVSVQIG
jgi:hypothetical protein